MQVTIEQVLPCEDVDTFYPTYVAAMSPLLERAAARHLLTEEEFGKEMSDPRIEKYVARDDDGQAIGLTSVGRDLAAFEWLEPAYYLSRYRDAIERDAMFYLGYALVEPTRQRSQALLMMTTELNRSVSRARGVIGFDICTFNVANGLDRFAAKMVAPAELVPIDTQTYYVADFRHLEAGTGRLPLATARTPAAALRTVTVAERPDLADGIGGLLASRWPTFMLAGRPGHDVDLDDLLRQVPQHQVLVLDANDRVQGVGLSVPLTWEGTQLDLPTGWDDAVTRSARLLGEGGLANAASALSVTVAPEHARQGVAERLLEAMRRAAARAGGSALIAPVRPTRKARYPLVDLVDYLSWRTEDGQMFDPWLRTHLQLGATLITVAEASMSITGTLAEWRSWLDEPLPGPGSYVIGGGLVPLEIDENGGTYTEPNVRMVHRVQPGDLG